MNIHLTHEQICDFLLDPPAETAPSAVHLAGCRECAAELATLNTSLRSFRQSSRSFAESELARRPVVLTARRPRSMMAMPAYVAVAALFLGAVFIPLRLHRAPAVPVAPSVAVTVAAPAQSTESDEALLDEINQDLSASVPSPMEPLADPTANGSPASSTQGNNP